MRLRYNATYSPQYNPVEGLWAFAKRIFARHCITNDNFQDVNHMRGLVKKSIDDVPQSYLRNRVLKSLRLMREVLNKEESS